MVQRIFEIAEIEGEDINLSDIIHDADYKLFEEIKDLLNYPPRIIISKLYNDSLWREVVLKAARNYLSSVKIYNSVKEDGQRSRMRYGCGSK